MKRVFLVAAAAQWSSQGLKGPGTSRAFRFTCSDRPRGQAPHPNTDSRGTYPGLSHSLPTKSHPDEIRISNLGCGGSLAPFGRQRTGREANGR